MSSPCLSSTAVRISQRTGSWASTRNLGQTAVRGMLLSCRCSALSSAAPSGFSSWRRRWRTISRPLQSVWCPDSPHRRWRTCRAQRCWAARLRWWGARLYLRTGTRPSQITSTWTPPCKRSRSTKTARGEEEEVEAISANSELVSITIAWEARSGGEGGGREAAACAGRVTRRAQTLMRVLPRSLRAPEPRPLPLPTLSPQAWICTTPNASDWN
mmetsp:Transcript_14338/g.29706  ORF Transcript_14338/g.29706 Transcript_14338/m.29706 type:complete len:214 (-) Transcript_14338:73-714(-)